MIWIAVSALLLSSSPFVPYLLMREPARPSPGFLGYLDRAFVDWTSRLVHRGLLDDDHWLLECPGYLFSCCPTIRKIDADPEVLNQLTDMIPVHAFTYVLTRRLAEAAVQLSACWLLAGFLMLLAFSTLRAVQTSSRQRQHGWNTAGTSLRWWNLKNVCLLFSLVLLSILVPTLVERAVGGVLDYQLQILNGRSTNSPSFSILAPWRVKDTPSSRDPLSLLHLLDFTRLHQSLYGRTNHSPVAPSSALCQQTALSLSCWSVVAFVGTAYTVVTMAFWALVWRPVKSLFCGLATDKLTQSRTLKDRRLPVQAEREEEKCSKEVLDPSAKRSFSAINFTTNLEKKNKPSMTCDTLVEHFDQYIYPDPDILFSEKGDVTMSSKNRERSHNPRPESGDGPEVGRGRPLPVRPRYVSRGTYACLDSADEYSLKD